MRTTNGAECGGANELETRPDLEDHNDDNYFSSWILPANFDCNEDVG